MRSNSGRGELIRSELSRCRWRQALQATRFAFSAFFVLRILDPRVQHVLDRVAECLRDAPNLAQGKITLIQLTLRNSFIDDLVDQLLDLLRSRFIQTSRSTLDGIRQTDDAALFELR